MLVPVEDAQSSSARPGRRQFQVGPPAPKGQHGAELNRTLDQGGAASGAAGPASAPRAQACEARPGARRATSRGAPQIEVAPNVMLTGYSAQPFSSLPIVQLADPASMPPTGVAT